MNIKYIKKKRKKEKENKDALWEAVIGTGKAEGEAGPIMICVQQKLPVSRVVHVVEPIAKQIQGFC